MAADPTTEEFGLDINRFVQDLGQSQHSLTRQLKDLYKAAVRLGLYDAADWLQARFAADEPCMAVIQHGPGHQSRTRCTVKGPHEIHQAAPMRHVLRWRGAVGTTDFWDDTDVDD